MRGIPLDEWHKRMWEQLQEGKTRTKMSFILETFNKVGDVALKSVMILKSCCFACLYDSILFTGTCKLCPIGSCTQNGCLDGLICLMSVQKMKKIDALSQTKLRI